MTQIKSYKNINISNYFMPTLVGTFMQCVASKLPMTLAILDFPNLNELNFNKHLKRILDIVTQNLRDKDKIFCHKKQITLVLPHVPKNDGESLLIRIVEKLSNIEINMGSLIATAGFSGLPQDCDSPLTLKKCALSALKKAHLDENNGVIGFFKEKRNNKRIPFRTEIRYTLPGSSEYIGYSKNISEYGIVISSSHNIPSSPNTELSLYIKDITDRDAPIRAKILWNKNQLFTNRVDVGLCFLDIEDSIKQKIAKHINQIAPKLITKINS